MPVVIWCKMPDRIFFLSMTTSLVSLNCGILPWPLSGASVWLFIRSPFLLEPFHVLVQHFLNHNNKTLLFFPLSRCNISVMTFVVKSSKGINPKANSRFHWRLTTCRLMLWLYSLVIFQNMQFHSVMKYHKPPANQHTPQHPIAKNEPAPHCDKVQVYRATIRRGQRDRGCFVSGRRSHLLGRRSNRPANCPRTIPWDFHACHITRRRSVGISRLRSWNENRFRAVHLERYAPRCSSRYPMSASHRN